MGIIFSIEEKKKPNKESQILKKNDLKRSRKTKKGEFLNGVLVKVL